MRSGLPLHNKDGSINESVAAFFQKATESPSLAKKASSLYEAASQFAINGFKRTTPEQLDARKAICATCEFWNPAGFAGTGSCNKCGCSTQAKLRMSTSKCPIDKWGPVDVRQTD
jgi:hypothetical protein